METKYFVFVLILIFILAYNNDYKNNQNVQEEQQHDKSFKHIVMADDIIRVSSDLGKIGTGLLI